LEQALGVELHVVDGVVVACEPGSGPPPSVQDHAKAFLTWLQGHAQIAGNEVPVKMLEDLLYPHFANEMGWQPLAWRTIAGAFVRLRGVKKRQRDCRGGDDDRSGPMPIVYRIPKPRKEG
jgi:hypothetical protein